MNLSAVVEGLLFAVGDEGLTKEEIGNVLEVSDEELNNVLAFLENEYTSINRGICLSYLGGRYKLVTKKEHKDYLQKLMNLSENDNLSQSALEVLAIIAYNQPVTRSMVDDIRGISSSHMIHKLVYKNLICEMGRSETAGRPILYGTTPLFLDYFGLNALSELPKIEVQAEDKETELYHSKYTEEEI